MNTLWERPAAIRFAERKRDGMKAKNAAGMLVLVLGMPALAGCSGEFEIPFFPLGAEETVTGEVCQVTEDSILLRTESPEEDGADAGENKTEAEHNPAPEFTGEEQKITLTKDTVVRPGKLEEDEQDESETPEDAREELSAADILEGDVISVSLDQKGRASEILVISQAKSRGAGKLREAEDYDAATEFAVDIVTDGETYGSAGTDENAVHVYGEARAFLKNAEITRTSRDSTGGSPAASYGIGSALLTTNGISYIRDSRISTDAPGGAGIFSYGNALAYAMDTAVATRQDLSGGIHAAGGGTLYAWNLEVETSGASSAAISSGRGGGKIAAEGGIYRTLGPDSPAVYCGADIAIREALLTADASEAACIDGGNALHLYDCELTGNMGDDLYNDSAWNVLVYHGTSGNFEPGKGTFEMKGGSLTAKNGGIFYTTNTESTITLSGVKILYPDVLDFFLKCTGNDHQGGWGKAGANGADCLFTAENQDMEGDILWDDISQLDFYMIKQSTLKGAVLHEKSNAGKNQDGYCNLYIEEGSTWIVTGDSALNRLSCSGRIEDDEGKTVTIRGRDGTVYVQGNGKYTVTVLSHEAAANLSGASEMTRWMDHQAELPEEFL
ncbi:MAG: hypothetical protein HFH18_10695 [Ruminococcus sp.]|nr:hypothetical protein [Ruminococcus sp.]